VTSSTHSTEGKVADDDEGINAELCDVVLMVQGTKLLAHRIILESRCRYLKGLINVVEKDKLQLLNNLEEENEESTSKQSNSSSSANTLEMDGQKVKRLEVPIDSEFATAVTVKALLVYLYTDVLECPPHRIALLRKLAQEYHLDRLVALCVSSLGFSQQYMSQINDNDGSKSGIPKSSFEKEMNTAVNSCPLADVLLFNGSKPMKEEGLKEERDDDDSEDEVKQIWAHRALLNHVEYFHTLLNGKYREGTASQLKVVLQNNKTCDNSGGNDGSLLLLSSFLDPVPQQQPSRPYIEIDISGLIEDGLSFKTLLRLIRFVYTGSASVVPREDPNAITGIPHYIHVYHSPLIYCYRVYPHLFRSLSFSLSHTHIYIHFRHI